MPVHYPSDFSLDKASSRYYSYYQLVLSKWRLRQQNIQAGKAVIVEDNVEFRLTNNALIEIGDHTVISSYAYFLMTKPKPVLRIGKQVGIGRHCQLLVKGSVEIGDYTRIGSFVSIRDQIHQSFKYSDEKVIDTHSDISPVKIGRNVWIGNYSTIFPGVTISDNAVISTYSLVMRDVPEGVVVAGQPARAVNKRNK